MDIIVVKVATSPEELKAIHVIRESVFQKEQGISFTLDFDGLDESCDQLLAYVNDKPVGTARIKYLNNEIAKIERLAVLSTARGQSIGKRIMQSALEILCNKNITEAVIHAQEYIKALHQKLGFQEEGEVFEEAGIRHVKMTKKLKKNCEEVTREQKFEGIPENKAG